MFDTGYLTSAYGKDNTYVFPNKETRSSLIS